MNVGTVMGLIIMTIVAIIMITIGVVQYTKKDIPVGFYNVIDPPKKEEISNIEEWNKKHGIIWIVYGICIELGYLLSLIMPIEILEIIFSMGGVILPLPFMILRHNYLVKKYQRK